MRLFRVFVFIFASAALLLLFAALPVFAVASVSVTGISALREDDVLKTAGLDKNPNFFTISTGGVKKRLKANPYIEDAILTKKFPNAVSLHVLERKVYGYIEDTGNYIYIDKEGRVLDISDAFTERLPVVAGLKYTSYAKGEYLPVDRPSAFATVVLLANLFKAYELEHDIVRVDIKNEQDIRLYADNIEVKMGSVSEVYDKVRYLKEILPRLTDKSGTLDLNTNYKGEAARFRPLT